MMEHKNYMTQQIGGSVLTSKRFFGCSFILTRGVDVSLPGGLFLYTVYYGCAPLRKFYFEYTKLCAHDPLKS